MQLTEGTAMAATQSRLVLDYVADIFQLFVAQFAFMEPAKKDAWGMSPTPHGRCAHTRICYEKKRFVPLRTVGVSEGTDWNINVYVR